jgi:hypothetical protein
MELLRSEQRLHQDLVVPSHKRAREEYDEHQGLPRAPEPKPPQKLVQAMARSSNREGDDRSWTSRMVAVAERAGGGPIGLDEKNWGAKGIHR